ncbi:MAG: nucleoside deaminase [Candidatus Babeliaceae bacterium]
MHYKNDESYMYRALRLAQKAQREQEVPIGALVIDSKGTIIGRGYNRVERYKSQSQHAEIRALTQATKKINDWRLEKCTLYVTLEPCVMCINLCALSRIERIVFGAHSPLFGYNRESENKKAHYMKHIKNITAGVLAYESTLLLKDFFHQKREMHHE